VLSNSLALGFPYADVPEMGSAVAVVTDADPQLARRLADELAGAWWQRRADFRGRFVLIDEALDRAIGLPGPVCLLDMGDNVGGGSPADGTLLAHALHDRQLSKSFVCLYDPPAVAQAAAAGPGARLRLAVGGHTDSLHGAPLLAEFVVERLCAGTFSESRPRHGGATQFDQGPTAIVTAESGLTVMLTSARMAPMSLNQLVSCGLDPAGFRFLVAKGVHAPVAAYGEVCPSSIRVDTPGVTSADLRRLSYHRRRVPMEPFEPEAIWPKASGRVG
jgi:microcystin degradation protein MlrC